MSATRNAAKAMAGLFAACALATPFLVDDEGWRLKTYADPVGISTACAGVTGAGVVAGRTYSELECQGMTAAAAVRIASAIQPCIPPDLPIETHAAFIRFAYNIGPTKFCKSTLARKAMAGDLRGACAGLSAWIYAGGRVLPGLVTRRASERAQCLKGLA